MPVNYSVKYTQKIQTVSSSTVPSTVPPHTSNDLSSVDSPPPIQPHVEQANHNPDECIQEEIKGELIDDANFWLKDCAHQTKGIEIYANKINIDVNTEPPEGKKIQYVFFQTTEDKLKFRVFFQDPDIIPIKSEFNTDEYGFLCNAGQRPKSVRQQERKNKTSFMSAHCLFIGA